MPLGFRWDSREIPVANGKGALPPKYCMKNRVDMMLRIWGPGPGATLEGLCWGGETLQYHVVRATDFWTGDPLANAKHKRCFFLVVKHTDHCSV